MCETTKDQLNTIVKLRKKIVYETLPKVIEKIIKSCHIEANTGKTGMSIPLNKLYQFFPDVNDDLIYQHARNTLSYWFPIFETILRDQHNLKVKLERDYIYISWE